MEPRLKTRLRIQAFLRRCDLAFYPGAVVHQGDDDAGDIIVCQRQRDGVIHLWRSGAEGWYVVLETTDEAAVNQRLSRARAVDGDLWVVEVETPPGAEIILP